MKKTLSTLCLFIAAIVFSNTLAGQSKKYAYLLGIGEYCNSSGLSSLESVDNDLYYMKSALESQGFECVAVNASEFTKPEILSSFNKHLSNKVTPNDIALFYFTGHGLQVENQDGDDCDEVDGLDEAIVLSNYTKGIADKDHLILDDEIDELLSPIRRRIGKNGQLILIFDACHSGSLSRSMKGKANQTFQQYTSLSFSDCIEQGTEEKIAPIVGLYSSLDDEQSFEFGGDNQKFGVFTYALIEQMKSCDTDYSYGDWLAQTKWFMQDKFYNQQIPVSEGDIDALIWKNGIEKSSIKQGLGRKGVLGTVLSPSITLPRGADLAIYPKGTLDTSLVEPRMILSAGEYKVEGGIVSILKGGNEEFEDGDLLFFPSKGLEIQPLGLYFPMQDSEVLQNLNALLEMQPFLKLVDSPEQAALQLITADNNMILETTEGDELLKRESFDEFSSKSLFRYFRESLVGYNNSKQLESLYTFESDVDIDWSICSIKNQGSLVTENVEELILGDTFDLTLVNKESNQIFAYLFHQDKSYDLKKVPFKYEVLGPGEQMNLLNRYVAAEPLGTDIFTLVVSRTKIMDDRYLIGIDKEEYPMDYFFTSLSKNQPIMYSLLSYLPKDLIQVETKTISIKKRE